jgi:phage gpG-like protein
MTQISIEVDGVRETVAAFEKVERGIVDFRQLGTWDWVESEFYKIQKQIFDSEGSAGRGGKWKPLSTNYAVAKAKHYGNMPILQASGAMYREFTSKAGQVDKQAQEMTLGFSAPAIYHMGKGGRTKMPYRSSLDLTPEQEKTILKPVEKKIRQLIDNAKLRDIRGF